MRGLARQAATAALLLVAARSATAQERPRTRPELRLDATSARVSRLEGSAGLVVPLGIYGRLALSGGGGVARAAGATRTAARADAIARFELDPLNQRPHSVYLGGGVTWLATEGERGRAYLALVGALELKTRAGWVPSVELGIGGGARVGVAFRRAMQSWR
ncbi:MAG TPA: hypothetical protein VHM30_20070 [Gemmatimonadaceae bacterium]|nr:hypothetical protein [Gemmatimonadaceae bacterium]